MNDKLDAERLYYVKKKNGDVCIRQSHFVDFDDNDIEEVLATVPSYQELQDLKKYEKTINSYNGMPIDYTIACETVNKLLDEKDVLKKKIHILTESQMKLENTIGEVGEENARLKKLLKEVKEFIEEENPKDFTIMSERMDELLSKINEVLSNRVRSNNEY